MELKDIYGPVSDNIAALDVRLKNLYSEFDGNEIKSIAKYFFKSSGKYLRPTLAFLSAGAVSSEGDIDNEKLIELGMSLELLHSASLIHDDVIDGDYTRRGQKTVNNIYGNKIAVLAGDIFHGYSYSILSKNFNRDFSEELINLSINMCKAEIIQANGIKDDDTYLEMIKGKTALFTSSCCKLGAMAGSATCSQVSELAKYGLYFGLAYQIKDDFSDCDMPDGISVTLEDAYRYADMAKKAVKQVGENMYTDILCKFVDYVI